MTSKYTLDFGEAIIFTHALASVGIVAVLVILIAPVSDPQIIIRSVVDPISM